MDPRRVLDVGTGFGKWGFLIREALDFMRENLEPADWQVTIDGIDAQAPPSPLLTWVYNSMRDDDVCEVADELRGYDLVIPGDMPEHLDVADGVTLLRRLLSGNRNVIVTTPREFLAQGAIGQNPYERHLSFWSASMFGEWRHLADVAGSTLVVVLAGERATYPSDAQVRADRIVNRLPVVSKRRAASRAAKEGLPRLILERRGR